MSNRVTIITGDDIAVPVQLRKGNQTFVIDPGATVQAQLRHGDTAVGGTVTVSEATPGSDWTTSLIVPIFPSSDTTNFDPRDTHYLSMEVQVNDSGKTTWILENVANVKLGLIA